MIVGASVLQLPAILKAKKLGYNVAVVDYNQDAIGVKYADKYYCVSTKDEDAVLAAAIDFMPDGIMTLATDMPMRGIARSTEKLHLPGINYETAYRATDKYEMIRVFDQHRVPIPWYYIIEKEEDLSDLKDNIVFPCIIKPTDSSGSQGVYKINDFAELLRYYPYSASCSISSRVIVEEFLEGPEVSVEIMVVEGNAFVLQVTDKLTTGAPHFVEMGHTQPSQLPNSVLELIRRIAVDACCAVGINAGPAHVEMKVTKRGPVMIELGARMGGDNITTHLVPLSTGIDMVEAVIRYALGEVPNVVPSIDKGAAIRYFSPPEGKITAIDNIDDALSLPGVKQIVFTKNIGDFSTEIKSSSDRVGFVIAQGESASDAIDICNKVLNIIKFTIE